MKYRWEIESKIETAAKIGWNYHGKTMCPTSSETLMFELLLDIRELLIRLTKEAESIHDDIE